jgi:hypothetical protein
MLMKRAERLEQQRAELLEALKEANHLDEINIKMFRIEQRRKKGSTGIAVDDDDDALAWRKLTDTAAQLIARRNKAITRAEAAE